MKINNLNIFPVLIKYVENFLNIDECKNILKDFKNIKLTDHFLLKGNAKSSFFKEDKILNKTNKNILNNLNKISNEYAKELGLKEIIITNSWINVQNKNSSFDKHCHPGSVVSSALYLKIDDKSSPINFFNPNPYAYITPFVTPNETNFNYLQFKPKIGDLILFPSWLMHSSENGINKSKERIVLSFNTGYC
jgi:uncharacterized protein (TIGR02466 family)